MTTGFRYYTSHFAVVDSGIIYKVLCNIASGASVSGAEHEPCAICERVLPGHLHSLRHEADEADGRPSVTDATV